MFKALHDFKLLKITKAQLQQLIGENLYQVKIQKPIIINNQDVIFVLEKYRKNEITVNELVNWVNVVWFTDLFDYADKYQNAIASVMTELEELDENGKELTAENIESYINALRNNHELW